MQIKNPLIRILFLLILMKKGTLIVMLILMVLSASACSVNDEEVEVLLTIDDVSIESVFDQLYSTGASRFGEMLGVHLRNNSCDFSRNRGYFWLDYRSEALGEYRSIFFIIHPSLISIRFYVRSPDTGENFGFGYIYYPRSRELHKRAGQVFLSEYKDDMRVEEPSDDFLARLGLTQIEVEYLHHWFLFEYFLPKWYEHNREFTDFSPDNWGEFTLMDETAKVQ